MAFEEKRAWIALVIAVITYVGYVAVVLVRAGDGPLTEVAYVGPLLVAIGAGIVVVIIATMVIGMTSPREDVHPDERDREIERFGEHVGQAFVVIGALAGLVLAMADVDQFWIANVIVLGFFVSAILEGLSRIAAYRTGFQPW